jgi:hypothetical protein
MIPSSTGGIIPQSEFVNMPTSLFTQHSRRLERLVQGVKDYAREAGVAETAASRRVLNASHELARLEAGGSLSVKTLERREKDLRDLRRALKGKAHRQQAVSA